MINKFKQLNLPNKILSIIMWATSALFIFGGTVDLVNGGKTAPLTIGAGVIFFLIGVLPLVIYDIIAEAEKTQVKEPDVAEADRSRLEQKIVNNIGNVEVKTLYYIAEIIEMAAEIGGANKNQKQK